MTPTSLPASTPSASPSVTAPTAAANANSAAATTPFDFFMMLGQLVSAAAPVTSAATKTPGVTSEQATEPTAIEGEGVAPEMLTALPLPLPLPLETPKAAAAPNDPALLMKEVDFHKSGGKLSPLTLDSRMVDALSSELAGPSSDATTALESPSPLQHSALELKPNSTAMKAAEAAMSRPVQAPVGGEGWADEIGARITMMAEQGKHTASLRLSPEHLGPLEIRVTINDDQAQVWFGAAHADTRAAIEHALPRLRELFAAQGMSLTDAGVFHEPPREQSPASAHGPNASGHAPTEDAEPISAVAIKLGLVDAYA